MVSPGKINKEIEDSRVVIKWLSGGINEIGAEAHK